MPPKKQFYYAVRVGQIPGIYNSWAEAEIQVKGFTGAIHKKFTTREDAKLFMEEKTLQDTIDEYIDNMISST